MNYSTVKTLTEVRHVPELRKNLTSMGVLDAAGYKFAVQGGVMKVSKGILVVIKAIRIGNLYKLEGSSEVSQVAVVSEAASDPACLWHQRLGHMSEKGLKVLMDRKLLPSIKFLNFNFCKHCVFGKQARQKFKVGMDVRKGNLNYI